MNRNCAYIIVNAIFPSNTANFARIDRNLSLAFMISFSWNSQVSESLCKSSDKPSKPCWRMQSKINNLFESSKKRMQKVITG